MICAILERMWCVGPTHTLRYILHAPKFSPLPTVIPFSTDNQVTTLVFIISESQLWCTMVVAMQNSQIILIITSKKWHVWPKMTELLYHCISSTSESFQGVGLLVNWLWLCAYFPNEHGIPIQQDLVLFVIPCKCYYLYSVWMMNYIIFSYCRHTS